MFVCLAASSCVCVFALPHRSGRSPVLRMAIMDVKAEQNPAFSWYDVPYVMTLPKNPSKVEEAAKVAAAKLDGEQDNVLELVQNKISNDMAVMKLWVERMKDKEAMAQGALRSKKLALKNAGQAAALSFVDAVLDFKEESDSNLAGIISAKNLTVQALCSNPLSGKNGASSIIVIDMNAMEPAAQRRKLTAGLTLVTGNESRDVAIVLLPWDRDTSFSSQVVCLGPPKVLHRSLQTSWLVVCGSLLSRFLSLSLSLALAARRCINMLVHTCCVRGCVRGCVLVGKCICVDMCVNVCVSVRMCNCACMCMWVRMCLCINMCLVVYVCRLNALCANYCHFMQEVKRLGPGHICSS
jgi:hypothetical protein